jgi:hypothetical protein
VQRMAPSCHSLLCCCNLNSPVLLELAQGISMSMRKLWRYHEFMRFGCERKQLRGQFSEEYENPVVL